MRAYLVEIWFGSISHAAMDRSVRHEVAQGKHVVLVGDLNVVASADDIHPAIYPKGDPCFGYDAREVKV